MDMSLSEMTERQLRAAIASGVRSIRENGECDNESDYLCCHKCGVPDFKRELERRAELKRVLAEYGIKAETHLSYTALSVERARELGLI